MGKIPVRSKIEKNQRKKSAKKNQKVPPSNNANKITKIKHTKGRKSRKKQFQFKKKDQSENGE